MNTLELIKDSCLFGGTVPNKRTEEVRTFLDNLEKQSTIPVAVQQSEQLFCGVKGGFCPYEESDRKCRAEHKCINQVAK